MRTCWLATLALLPLLAGAPARAQEQQEARLTLLHTTDLHGALTAFDYSADRPAPRGLVKLATLIESARREAIPTLLLDAGDAFQGSLLETAYRRGDRKLPEPMMAAMARLGYDAMAVGNHEFSFGLAEAERARSAAGFPWLSANVVRTRDGSPLFQTTLIKPLGPVRIGVIGITTSAVPVLEDSSHWTGLGFLDPVEVAGREARRLRETERCDAVVILAHTGLEPARTVTAADSGRDGARGSGDAPAGESTEARRGSGLLEENWGRRLAGVPGVDLVILGHTHEAIPFRWIGGTLVTQAGKWGEALGRVDFVFTRADSAEAWKLATRRARLVAVADTTADDRALSEFAEPYHRAAQSFLSEALGTAARDLEAPEGRLGEGPTWELVQRVQLEASGADVSIAAMEAPRARIARGPVTMRDVVRLLPHENTLAVVELTGAQLKETLERSVRDLPRYDFEADRPIDAFGSSFGFDAAEGVSYSVDLTRPGGARIVGLSFQGAPLALDRRLKVAVNSYRLAGAGGFDAVRNAPRLWRSEKDVRDLVADHIRRAGTLEGGFTRSWTLLPDYLTRAERPLIDLLVRQRVLGPEQATRLEPGRPASRAELARWLTRAFGWRERRPSGAFRDVPDSLAPWFDALLKRRVLGELASDGRIRPLGSVRLPVALEWCERAARHARYALAQAPDRRFQNGLLAGLSGRSGEWPARERPDTLTRGHALALVANTRYPTIRVLETTDFHGAILTTGRDRATGRAVGSSAVLAAHIARLRAANPEGTVLLDGGDCYQGTMISNLQHGRPVVEQMNLLGYTAQAVGNHEFDWSADTLVKRVREMRFAALGANMRERATGRLPRWVRADTAFTRRGVRVGVVGLCYRNTPSVTLAKHVEHLRFEDDSAAAAGRVPALRAANDVVIGVGHVPAESDSSRRALGGDLPRLARGVRGVDLWLGGHSHNQVIDKVGAVPVLIAGSHGQVVAVCDMVVDPVAHRVVETRSELVPTFVDEVKPDSVVLAHVERWNAAVGPIASQPVGMNARDLTRNRGGESAVGNMVADAMRSSVQADVALQNSGGLRADLPQGPVTKGRIYEIMPFDNVVFTLELTGEEVVRAIEQALRSGRVTQVSGVRYTFDPGRAAGQRVVSVTKDSGETLAPDSLYKVAINDFMATGGDDYDVLSGGRNRTNTGILVRDVLEDFVAERSKDGAALDYRTEGRVRRVESRSGTRE